MVDYLRSCYTAPWRVNENNTIPLRGRFYRAFQGADIARDAYFYRSATWLDPWDREEMWDQWPHDSDWSDGHRLIDTPLIRSFDTLRANGRCLGQEVTQLVAGRGGLPKICYASPDPPLSLFNTHNGGSFVKVTTGDSVLFPINVDPANFATYLGSGNWRWDYHHITSEEIGEINIGNTIGSLFYTLVGAPSMFSVRFDFNTPPSGITYQSDPGVPLNGWSYDPSSPFPMIVQMSVFR